MRISARADYALRALIELAGAYPEPRKGDELAQAQGIPLKFLGNILQQLKSAGLIRTLRGAEGGYWLTVSPETITLADVIRAVEGPLANVRGTRPEALRYAGKAEALREVWIAVRASLRAVLEEVTLADVAKGRLPELVQALAADPAAWEPHLTTKLI